MSSVRIFLSFDVEHDGDLCDLALDPSSRGSAGFVVTARSRAGEVTDRWRDVTRREIRNSDQVIVLCGEHTRESAAMDAELCIAQEEEKPFFLLWGRRDRDCTMPERVQRTACMYRWDRETVQQQLSASLRKQQLVQVPDRYKRPHNPKTPAIVTPPHQGGDPDQSSK
jgi:hypothetical protein